MRLPGEAHDTIVGFSHYLPLSLLPDDFWTEMGISPSFRMTDGLNNEIPIHVVDLDVVGKTGALWFRYDKANTHHAFFIHYASPTSVGFDHGGPYGSMAVWSNYNEAITLNEDFADGQVLNHVNAGVGIPYSNDATFVGNQVDSVLEMKANRFFATKENRVSFGSGTYDIHITPMTFIFLFKLVEIPSGIEHMFGNWRNLVGQNPYRVVITPDQLGIQFGQLGLGGGNFTGFGEFADMAVDTWFLGVLCYNFDLGVVEIDINRINRNLDWPQADAIYDNESAVRTVGGLGSNSSNMILSALLTYTGYLNKEQRDVIFDNYFEPEDFWRIMAVPGQAMTFASPIEENVCFSSRMEKNLCFSSHIKP